MITETNKAYSPDLIAIDGVGAFADNGQYICTHVNVDRPVSSGKLAGSLKNTTAYGPTYGFDGFR
jgi:hypothetical protein